jgi:hypothetical protein
MASDAPSEVHTPMMRSLREAIMNGDRLSAPSQRHFMIPSGGENHDGPEGTVCHARGIRVFDLPVAVIMMTDIALMATVAFLVLLGCLLELAARSTVGARRRSRPNHDALQAMAHVEAQVSKEGGHFGRPWGHPHRRPV